MAKYTNTMTHDNIRKVYHEVIRPRCNIRKVDGPEVIDAIISNYATKIKQFYDDEKRDQELCNIPTFANKTEKATKHQWVQDNFENFLATTDNKNVCEVYYLSHLGFISALEYSPDGTHIVVGHSTGLIQVRDGTTGHVLSTLRKPQFPPHAICSLIYSKTEERVCYAACEDAAVYRLVVPLTVKAQGDGGQAQERLPELLDWQFYGASAVNPNVTPVFNEKSSILSMDVNSTEKWMAVGTSDGTVKLVDMETQVLLQGFRPPKLRMSVTPPRLQRTHTGRVVALRCHPTWPDVVVSGSWDDTVRVWDSRIKVGCVMTFGGVHVCGNSVDVNRNLCVSGSWKPFEALAAWDLVGKKLLHSVKVQNRRPDVDGEYFYSCRFWRSSDYNRKGKYVIVGGSGTNCLEVINLHNRYIACSYPALGAVQAVASYQDRIAFGGTEPAFRVVSFHDEKHEKMEAQENGVDVVAWAKHGLDATEEGLENFLGEENFDNVEWEA